MTILNCPVTTKPLWIPNAAEEVETEIVWPVDLSCCVIPVTVPPTDLSPFVAVAVDLLWRKTCFRFGICAIEIRPCLPGCTCFPKACSCECSWLRFDLRQHVGHPIESVDAVKVDNVDVPPAGNWYVANNRYLVPIRDGLLWCWPPQDLNLETGSVGTWSIELTIGEMPGASLLFAAADLACQMWKSCTPGQVCDIPPNAVSVTRDGVTVNLETGLLAYPPVKMALDAYPCPQKLRSRITDPAEWYPSVVV